MNEIIGAAIQLLFFALFIATAWQYARRRDPLSLDLMLVFASVAGLYVVTFIGSIVGELPPWLTVAAVVSLLAQPLLILRVCVRTGVARPRTWWVAAIAFVASLVPVIVLRPLEAWMAVPPLLVAVIIEAIAASSLGRSALQRSGAARARLLIAAGASGLFALALVALGLGSTLGEIGSAAVLLIGLLSALGYALAFLPIGWLTHLWHASSGFTFTQELIDDPTATATDVWRRLAVSTRRITGARQAIVIVSHAGEPPEVTFWPHVEVIGRALPPEAIAELTAASAKSHEQTSEAWPHLRHALDTPVGALLMSVPAAARPDEGVTVAWITARRSLFAANDRELIEILAGQAAVFADRAAMVRAQATHAETLAASYAALERASAAKSDFLASMSHELRTPLSAIIGFASLMRDEPTENDSVTVPREWVEHIHSSGEHLLSLINDVLDLSKVEAGRLELERGQVDLASAVTELLGGIRPLADAKGLTLVSTVQRIEVMADRGRLRQILYNLVSNAIKFTPRHGSVTVSSDVVDGEARITVSDTGIGIAAENHERIFTEFSQLGDAATRSAGTGLGLALTRRLVQAHGGRIEVASTLGKGSHFTVNLPLAATQSPKASPASGIDRPTTVDVGGILLIEDDPSAVRLIRTYLEGDGHRLRVASDGDGGLAEARRAPPAAILLDVLLPGRDGWEILRELKADPVLREVPVVVLTVVDERQLGIALGAVDYFLKPVDRDVLLERLARYKYAPRGDRDAARVLVIDDEPIALSMVEAALTSAGYEVEIALSGREGIDRVKSGGVDLVICDLVMPGLDGFEVVGRLRADEATRDLPILILTAHQLSAADKLRLNGHIVGVVSKGAFDVRADLNRWIARAMGAAQAAIQ